MHQFTLVLLQLVMLQFGRHEKSVTFFLYLIFFPVDERGGSYYETLEVTVGPKELQIPVGDTAEFQCSATSSGLFKTNNFRNL